MPVVYTLPAASSPLPIAINATPSWVNTNTSPTGVPPTSLAYGQGVINAPSASTLNGNATRYDNIARYGCGGYAIGLGLVLSAGSGVQVNVSDGHAIIEGLVEIRSAAPITCVDGASRWIWLKQDGTFVLQTTTAAPAANAVFLGKVTCAGGVVTVIDGSGVVYFRSGTLWRQTSDVGPPLDTPDTTIRLVTKTSSGSYYWDGYTHNALGGTDAYPQWRKFTFSYTDLSTAGLTIAKNLSLLPAGSLVHAVKLRITTLFTGPGIATLGFDVGITGTTNKYISAFNGMVVGQTSYGTLSLESSTGTVQSLLTATSTGANLNVLTQGSVDVWVMYSVAV